MPLSEDEKAFINDLVLQAFNRVSLYAANPPEGKDATLYYLDIINFCGLSMLGSSLATQIKACEIMEIDTSTFASDVKEKINQVLKDTNLPLRVVDSLRVVE